MAENEATEAGQSAESTEQAAGKPAAKSLTAEQTEKIASTKKILLDNLKAKGMPTLFNEEKKETEQDTTDYKSELESLYSDPIIKTLLDYKKTGKSLDDVFNFTPSEGIDVSKISRKDLFSQMLGSNSDFSADDVTVEMKRFEALSPLQQENEVKEYRNSLKSKSKATPEIFKNIQDTVAKELPNKQAQDKKVSEYIGILSKEVPVIKDIEGKEYSKEVQKSILEIAKRVSITTDLSPEAARKSIEIARQIVSPHETFTAGYALGAEEALKQFFGIDAGVSTPSRGTGASAADKTGHLYPKDIQDKKAAKKKFGLIDVNQ